jgi:hypothetical protein
VSQESGTSRSHGLLRLPDPDVPVYRIFPLWFFEEALRSRQLVLVPPRCWEDPFEVLTDSVILVDPRTAPPTARPLEAFLQPAYAQCWSRVEESDTLWRAYSRVFKDAHFNRNIYPKDEGVQVRSSPRKLLAAMRCWAQGEAGMSCFVGAIRYVPRAAVYRHFESLVERHGPHALGRGELRAELLLFKRNAFAHEAEVRLIAVDERDDAAEREVIAIAVDPSEVFDEVTFDPRLEPHEREGREYVARSLGYRGPFRASDLYRKTAFEIVFPEGWDNGQ